MRREKKTYKKFHLRSDRNLDRMHPDCTFLEVQDIDSREEMLSKERCIGMESIDKGHLGEVASVE